MVNLAFAVALNYLQAVQLFIKDGSWNGAYAFHASKISWFTVIVPFQLLKRQW